MGIELRHGKFCENGGTQKLSKEHVLEALRQLEAQHQRDINLRKVVARVLLYRAVLETRPIYVQELAEAYENLIHTEEDTKS